jgi:predicted RNase H-like HicB family nuclease
LGRYEFRNTFRESYGSGLSCGEFYAHVPSLGLTTHGLGLEGARQAAFDLARVWLAEKKAQGDPLPAPSEILFSTLDIPDDAFQST